MESYVRGYLFNESFFIGEKKKITINFVLDIFSTYDRPGMQKLRKEE